MVYVFFLVGLIGHFIWASLNKLYKFIIKPTCMQNSFCMERMLSVVRERLLVIMSGGDCLGFYGYVMVRERAIIFPPHKKFDKTTKFCQSIAVIITDGYYFVYNSVGIYR